VSDRAWQEITDELLIDGFHGEEPERESRLRWLIRKRSYPGSNPARPWQLWLVAGECMSLKAERSSHAFCVQAMDRLARAHRGGGYA
jgi:hypothetical protein